MNYTLEYIGLDKKLHSIPFKLKKNAETFALKCGLILFTIKAIKDTVPVSGGAK